MHVDVQYSSTDGDRLSTLDGGVHLLSERLVGTYGMFVIVTPHTT
jgi:hypothetical protein